jgi:NAD dependent epimerase/dehydratase family enzyme
MMQAIDDDTMSGTYHVTSPNPVTNAEMMATYRRLLGLPSPAVVARLGAPLLGSSGSLALTGRRVVPRRLVERGFVFQQPGFEATARYALERCGLL